MVVAREPGSELLGRLPQPRRLPQLGAAAVPKVFMVVVGSIPLALAADLVKASSCLHARSRPDLAPELAVEVSRLRA